MHLTCGCERPWTINGLTTMHTVDTMQGTTYRCPVHHQWVFKTPQEVFDD